MAIAVTRPRAQGYGAQIGDDWFRLAAGPDTPLRFYTRDSLAERVDQSGNPDENVLDLGFAFSRSNLTGGEGLDRFPRTVGEIPVETDPIRFWDSENMDIRRPDSGDPYSLKLVKDVLIFDTPTGTPVDMGTSRDNIYVIEGNNVLRFQDWADTTPEDTDGLGVVLVQLAVGQDNSVAVLDTDGNVWFKGSQTASYVQVYDKATDGDAAVGVWWVKERIVVATNDPASAAAGSLIEFLPTMGGPTGTPTAVPPTYTTFDTFEGECYDVVDAGHAIVACFSDGSLRSYVPQADTAGAAPLLTIRAQTDVPEGEVAYRLGHNLGVLLVFTIEEIPSSSKTTARVYTSAVLDVRFEFVVGQLQLLRTWEDSIEAAPSYTKAVVSTRDQMFFWIGEDTATFNLWRIDLTTTGVFRHGAHARTLAVGTVIFDDRLAFCDGADVVIEHLTDYVADAYLITPSITFGLNTAINWTNFTIEATNLNVTGTQVELYRSDDIAALQDKDHASWILVASLTAQAQSGVEQAIINATSNSLALQVRLFRSITRTDTPSLERFAVRGLPRHRDFIVEVPVNVSDIIEAPGRQPLRVAGKGEANHTRLLDLQGRSTTLTIPHPPMVVRGIVDNILEPVEYTTSHGSQSRMAVMMFRGTRIGGSQAVAGFGNAGWGVAPMGITTMGIGQVT